MRRGLRVGLVGEVGVVATGGDSEGVSSGVSGVGVGVEGGCANSPTAEAVSPGGGDSICESSANEFATSSAKFWVWSSDCAAGGGE